MNVDFIRRTRRDRRGLTLVELLVVLVILAVVTAIAVQSTESVIDQGRYNATQRTLQNIQDAIIGPVNQRAPDGSQLITGFVADMGRLPLPIYVNGAIVGDPLRELYDATAVTANGGTMYSVQSIQTATVYTNLNTNNVNSVVLSNAVWPPGLPPLLSSPPPPPGTTATPLTATLSCGWRGPYLQLAPGSAGRLLDGWGNPFQSLFQNQGSTVFPTTPLAGQSINVICSLGADNQFDAGIPTNPYNEDQYVPQQLAVPPVAPLASFSDANRTAGNVTITVSTWWTNTSNTPANTSLSNPVPGGTNDVVCVVLFAPANGLLTAQFLSNPAPPNQNNQYQNCFPLQGTQGQPNATPITNTFSGLMIGPCALQAFQFDSTQMTVRKRSLVTYLVVPPGGVPPQTLILQ